MSSINFIRYDRASRLVRGCVMAPAPWEEPEVRMRRALLVIICAPWLASAPAQERDWSSQAFFFT